eukprot:1000-Heterococcus_DN1.PRE.6
MSAVCNECNSSSKSCGGSSGNGTAATREVNTASTAYRGVALSNADEQQVLLCDCIVYQSVSTVSTTYRGVALSGRAGARELYSL